MRYLKYTYSLIVTAAILAALLPNPAQAAGPWSSAYAGQSAPVTLGAGEEATIYVDFTNTGTQDWSNTGPNPVRLGTSHARDRVSSFSNDSWINSRRAATFSGRVEGGVVISDSTISPGETARFSFTIVAPPGNGAVQEYFQLVAEGVTWMEDYGMYFPITLTGGTYAYSYVGQTNPPAVTNPGQRVGLTLDLKNEGTATWRRDAFAAFRIGTSRPRDRVSAIANNTWTSPNRLGPFAGKVVAGSVVDSPTIAPGETARFSFDWVSPGGPGRYQEYFQPVVNGSHWLNDIGIYFLSQVPGTPYDYEYVGQTNVSGPLERGSQATVSLRLQNVGTATWQSSGSPPVRLATRRPSDHGSSFYTSPSWLSGNRIKLTRNLTDPGKDSGGETSVSPGEVGEWEFVVTATAIGGQYFLYLNPVAEGVTHFKDIGIHFPIYVSQPISVGIAEQGSIGVSPSVSSNATTTVRNDTVVCATPPAGSPIVLSYNGIYYSVSVSGQAVPACMSSTSPIRVEQPPNALATVSGLADNASFNQFRGTIALKGGAPGTWVVNELNLEDYLKGGGEVPDSWPLEAIKAQTVAARTFAARRIANPQNSLFDLYDDTRDQVYNGYLAEAAKPNTSVAVAQTTGLAVFYGSSLAQTFYSSDSGGHTEHNENVWGGSPIAYLRGKPDPYHKPDNWSKTVSNATLQASFGVGCTITAIGASPQNGDTYPSGRLKTVHIYCGAQVHHRTYLADDMRNRFTTRTSLITGITPSGNDFIISGRGFGHGIGMGQWGAYNQALQGRSFVDILTFYYTGVTIGSI